MKLIRYDGNPVLKPEPMQRWESCAVFNGGVITNGDKVHLLYRAVGEYDDYASHLGLAISDDGFLFRRVTPDPVFGPEEWPGCCATEDPRITQLEGKSYVTCVMAARPPREPNGSCTTVLLSTNDFRELRMCGTVTAPLSNDKDVVLFPEKINGKYAMLHRPFTWTRQWAGKKGVPWSYLDLPEKPAIWIAYSDDLKDWTGHKLVMTGNEWWEKSKIGAGPPPIRTEIGWLLIYHGVSLSHCYRAGMALLDLEDPSRVIARTQEPILEPQEDYELVGDVNNVVFPTGTIVAGEQLLVYYGAADKVMAVASCRLADALADLGQ